MYKDIRVQIKPMSVNTAWKGRRYKTQEYIQYEQDLGYLLPNSWIFTGKLYIEFGFSSLLADIDNPVKPLLDIMQKKYGFNDRDITELHLKKIQVHKGKEYILVRNCG